VDAASTQGLWMLPRRQDLSAFRQHSRMGARETVRGEGHGMQGPQDTRDSHRNATRAPGSAAMPSSEQHKA
jgi:hypothetical protein